MEDESPPTGRDACVRPGFAGFADRFSRSDCNGPALCLRRGAGWNPPANQSMVGADTSESERP
ncbi:hypothetical protein GCM10017643_39590 [Ancylobacter dichloromethanicus]|uniref:Uncharacterized protein n=1 Tax=Ancylobacter dichloromethanicus TaxID=518825 RepID=A0A9W6N146_9HYPH|nr:hypothetical protein GCM10017643_39590 [Ancylobacter dichloromethanicus]